MFEAARLRRRFAAALSGIVPSGIVPSGIVLCGILSPGLAADDLPITDLPITDMPIIDLPIADLPIADLPITDPTRPPHGTTAPPAKPVHGKLLLYSTQISDSKRTAVVNRQVVEVGSRVAGAVVAGIEPGRVILRRDSETIVLKLIETPVRRDSEDPS